MNKNYVYAKVKPLFSIFLILLIAFLLISTNKLNVAASPETTYFYVDPPEIRNVPSNDTFLIKINVTDAPPSYAWEVNVSWNPNILELFYKAEGDFLSRGTYTTLFNISPPTYAEANLQGEVMVGSSLFGDVPMNEWANGTGELFRLGFKVIGNGSCLLNLFDTVLLDHIVAGSPAPTYYPNEDCFFYNEPFHDIAITSVTTSLTETAELVTIDVVVKNEGNYTENSETFNVAVYADTEVYEYTYDAVDQLIKNTTVVGDEITVGTKTATEALAPGTTTTLTFTWNTTGVAGGAYTISAKVMGDDDTRNNLFIDDTVTVQAHDVAITNVAASPTKITVGDNVTINVTVENEGNFNETFDVTIYYDNTAIETKTVTSLESGNSTTLTFTWDTTDVAKDTYDITAKASVVPDEIDITDNTFTLENAVEVRGAAGPDILLYAAIAIVIIIVAAIAIYFLWFRKSR